MSKDRIPIPAPIKRKLLVECGHRCSISDCESRQDLVFHHINFVPSDNREENILVLCPNHAAMADKGKIDRKACISYKEKLRNVDRKAVVKSLKETVEEEGIDLETDAGFVRFVLERGRKYLMKKYGRLDVSLNKAIRILVAIGVGLLIPLIAVVSWSTYNHTFDPTIIYVELGLVIPAILAGLIFSVVRIIIKRRCDECGTNFGIEMTISKLVEKKAMYETQNYVHMREIQRNTYSCRFCQHTFTLNEMYEYNVPRNGI